jgi:hypothetical protein
MASEREDWYDHIEPEIRDVVRLLRDNGFNTTCSCGHEMYVELDLGNNLEDAELLARFLQEHDYKTFRLEATLLAPPDGMWVRRAIVYIGKWIPEISHD